jgi:hypothetical protein
VTHAPGLAALEDEMCAFTPDGLPSGRSPDRLDALVWAVSELLLGRGASRRFGILMRGRNPIDSVMPDADPGIQASVPQPGDSAILSATG